MSEIGNTIRLKAGKRKDDKKEEQRKTKKKNEEKVEWSLTNP